MFRSIFAVVLGYAALAAGPNLLPFLGLSPDPATPLTSEPVLLALAVGFAAAVVGGWMTALIAPSRRWKHIQVVVLLVLLAAAVKLLWARGGMPLSYEIAALATSVVGAFVGGSLKPGRRL